MPHPVPHALFSFTQSCGTVNRVTILTDKFGNPKAFAYIEFLEVDAVNNALLLDNTDLKGRPLKVSQKRTNVPGLKQRGRGGRGMAAGRGGGYGAPAYGAPYGGGRGGRGGFHGAPRGGYGWVSRRRAVRSGARLEAGLSSKA
jgi:polyadenylate-binding protein 2